MDATCVLTFHGIETRPRRDHDISWDAFAELLDRVARARRRVLAELDAPASSSGDGSPVVLTFDDGTDAHLHAGWQLARRGMPGVFFVPAGAIDTPGHLTRNELQELQALGHVVGSHAYHHAPLRGLTRDAVAAELAMSRDLLADLLGAEIRYFAPPGGVANPFLAEELEQHGFIASRSMRWGLYRPSDDRWSIPCLPVTQLTLRCGWIAHAIERRRLPRAMRLAWVAKSATPPALRSSLRKGAHLAERRMR